MRNAVLLCAVAAVCSACLVVPIPSGSSGSGKPRSFSEQPPPAGQPEPGQAQPPRSTSGAAAQPAMTPTSIEVHSDCPHTLPLFVGDKPKFGSGTKTSIGSNTTTTFPRRADGTASVWIIDDKENGVSQAAVGPGTRRLKIARNCTAITPD